MHSGNPLRAWSAALVLVVGLFSLGCSDQQAKTPSAYDIFMERFVSDDGSVDGTDTVSQQHVLAAAELLAALYGDQRLFNQLINDNTPTDDVDVLLTRVWASYVGQQSFGATVNTAAIEQLERLLVRDQQQRPFLASGGGGLFNVRLDQNLHPAVGLIANDNGGVWNEVQATAQELLSTLSYGVNNLPAEEAILSYRGEALLQPPLVFARDALNVPLYLALQYGNKSQEVRRFDSFLTAQSKGAPLQGVDLISGEPLEPLDAGSAHVFLPAVAQCRCGEGRAAVREAASQPLETVSFRGLLRAAIVQSMEF